MTATVDTRTAKIRVDDVEVDLTKTQLHCLIWINKNGARGTYSERTGKFVTRGSNLCPYSNDDVKKIVMSDLCERESLVGGGIQVLLKGQVAFTAALLEQTLKPENDGG